MQLPPLLRHAVDQELEGIPAARLAAAAAALSGRYRSEVRDGRLHVADQLAAQAYIATRLPATYAAVHTSLLSAAQNLPSFTPDSLLDVGAGPGTTLWAALPLWPGLTSIRLLETSAAMRAMGERLTVLSGQAGIEWITADIRRCDLTCYAADVVTVSYVLDELDPEDRSGLLSRLWAATRGLLVIVEPGTPAGWRRLLEARRQLTGAGARLVAPCPHAQDCPVSAPDWCHFAARVSRSRIHRVAKNGDAPWEDEAFAYLAVSRKTPAAAVSRVLAPPRKGSGRIELKLCTPEGQLKHRLLTRRHSAVFRQARRVDWGDPFGG